jgi:glucose/mannose-6-phosphate isomerase
VDQQTIVLAISYSGNTEETLSACRQARIRRLPTLAIASGGKLANWAQRNRVPFLYIPQGWPPRTALGYTAFAPAGLLARWGWLRESKIPLEKGLSSLERFILEELSPQIKESANPAKKLARQLMGRLPVLYGASGGWEGVVYRWRTQLEENAKTLAFHHIFPEMTHNEISGWGRPPSLKKGVVAIFLEDADAHPRVRLRMKFVRRLIQREGGKVARVQVSGATRFERMLKVIALGDFTSAYLGILYRVDPTPVVRVEALKVWLR